MKIMGTGWGAAPIDRDAAPAESHQQTFELQVFDGRQYQTIDTAAEEQLESLRGKFERLTGKVRRIVLQHKQRPAKPVYRYSSRGSSGPSLDGAATVAAYLDWAQAHGLLTVTVYADGKGTGQLGMSMAGRWGPNVRHVRVEDFLGPAPAAEEIEEDLT